MHNVAHKFRILKKIPGTYSDDHKICSIFTGALQLVTQNLLASLSGFESRKPHSLGMKLGPSCCYSLDPNPAWRKVSAALQRFGEQAEFKIQGSLNHSLFKIMEKFSSAKLMKYLPISRISTWNRSNSAKWKPGMLQIQFGKEFARGKGHIHGNLSKQPQLWTH